MLKGGGLMFEEYIPKVDCCSNSPSESLSLLLCPCTFLSPSHVDSGLDYTTCGKWDISKHGTSRDLESSCSLGLAFSCHWKLMKRCHRDSKPELACWRGLVDNGGTLTSCQTRGHQRLAGYSQVTS